MNCILVFSRRSLFVGGIFAFLFVLVFSCARDRLLTNQNEIRAELHKEMYPQISDVYNELIADEVSKRNPGEDIKSSLRQLSRQVEALQPTVGTTDFSNRVENVVNKALVVHNIPKKYLDPIISALQDASLEKDPRRQAKSIDEAIKHLAIPLEPKNRADFNATALLSEITKVKREGLPTSSIAASYEPQFASSKAVIQETLKQSDFGNAIGDIEEAFYDLSKDANSFADIGLDCIKSSLVSTLKFSSDKAYEIASLITQDISENNQQFNPNSSKKRILRFLDNDELKYNTLVEAIEHCHIPSSEVEIGTFNKALSSLMESTGGVKDPAQLSTLQKEEFVEQAPKVIDEAKKMADELDKLDRELARNTENKKRKLEEKISQERKIEKLLAKYNCKYCKDTSHRLENPDQCTECDVLKTKKKHVREDQEKLEKEIKDIEKQQEKIKKIKIALAAALFSIAIVLAALSRWDLAALAFSAAMALSTSGGQAGGEGGDGDGGGKSGDGTEMYSEYGGSGNSVGKGQNTDPVGKGQNTDPVGKSQNTDPVGKGQNTDPVGKGQSIDPVGKGQNTDPVGKGQSIDPVGKGQSIDPVGKGQNTDPVGKGQNTDPVGKGQSNSSDGKENNKEENSKDESTNNFPALPGDDWSPPERYYQNYYETTYLGREETFQEMTFILNLPPHNHVRSLCGGDIEKRVYTGILTNGQMFKSNLIEKRTIDGQRAIVNLVEEYQALSVECMPSEDIESCCEKLKQVAVIPPTVPKAPPPPPASRKEPGKTPPDEREKEPVDPSTLPAADVEDLPDFSTKGLKKVEAFDDTSEAPFRKFSRDGASYYIGFSLEHPYNEIEIYQLNPDGSKSLVAKVLKNLSILTEEGDVRSDLDMRIKEICAIEPPTGKPRKIIGVDASGIGIVIDLVDGNYPGSNVPNDKFIKRIGPSSGCQQ